MKTGIKRMITLMCFVSASAESADNDELEKRGIGCAAGIGLIAVGAALCIYGATKKRDVEDEIYHLILATDEFQENLINSGNTEVVEDIRLPSTYEFGNYHVTVLKGTSETYADILPSIKTRSDAVLAAASAKSVSDDVQVEVLNSFNKAVDDLTAEAAKDNGLKSLNDKASGSDIMGCGIALVTLGCSLCKKFC